MYIQYSCDYSHLTKEYQKVGLTVCMIGVLACIVYILMLYYLRHNTSIKVDIWDTNNVTPADFTITIDIPKGLWLDWASKRD